MLSRWQAAILMLILGAGALGIYLLFTLVGARAR